MNEMKNILFWKKRVNRNYFIIHIWCSKVFIEAQKDVNWNKGVGYVYMLGNVVLDLFGCLMTVHYRAMLFGRVGWERVKSSIFQR